MQPFLWLLCFSEPPKRVEGKQEGGKTKVKGTPGTTPLRTEGGLQLVNGGGMLVLHPWPAERQWARTSEELTETEPTPLTTSAGERPKRTQEEVTDSTKVRKITVRLLFPFSEFASLTSQKIT